jgi:hypothetical protein
MDYKELGGEEMVLKKGKRKNTTENKTKNTAAVTHAHKHKIGLVDTGCNVRIGNAYTVTPISVME